MKEFAEHFREIQPKFTRIYAKILTDADLTLPQYALLNQLLPLGSVSMTEISSRLQITKPAVTSLVDRLEEKKFLERRPHPKDRRVILLHILPKGVRIVSKIQSYALNILSKAYSQFGAVEQKAISRFYSTLSTTMDEFMGMTKK